MGCSCGGGNKKFFTQSKKKKNLSIRLQNFHAYYPMDPIASPFIVYYFTKKTLQKEIGKDMVSDASGISLRYCFSFI